MSEDQDEDLRFDGHHHPQYVCELTVSGLYVDVLNFAAAYFCRADHVEFGGAGLDFERVFRLPKELSGVRVSDAVAQYHQQYLLSPNEGVRYPIGQMYRRELLRDPLKVGDEENTKANLSRLCEEPVRVAPAQDMDTRHLVDASVLMQAVEADKRYRKYGAICEHSWMERYWGTESNAFWWEYGEQITPSEHGVSLYSRFRCFPGMPRPILIELGRRHPDLGLDFSVWTPNDDHFVFEVRNGHLVRDFLAHKVTR